MNETAEFRTLQVQVAPNGDIALPRMSADGTPYTFHLDGGVELEPAVRAFQSYIPAPPASLDQLYSKACANDTVTINSWKDQWIRQATANHEKYDFNKNSCYRVAGKEAYKPVIVAGSGPSLSKNAKYLNPTFHKRIYPDPVGEKWEMWGGRGDVRIVSCLHNFAYFEDLGVMTNDDYYVTLDAGEITIRELHEGGQHGAEWYWERTKDRTLVAYTSTHPELLAKWQGRILWYSTPPNPGTSTALKPIIDLSQVPAFNVGGNVLGASIYFARAILGCGLLITIGADFSFSRERKFHGWNSPYDAQFAGVQSATDIYGDRVYTWPSYYNFKCWMDYLACGGASNFTHVWINSTEGGILGAYPDGNIQQIKQMALRDVLSSLNIHRDLTVAMKESKECPRLLF